MEVVRQTKPLVFSEDDDELRVAYDNRGEPYRDGVQLEFRSRDCWSAVLLDCREVELLRDKLNEFIGAHSNKTEADELRSALECLVNAVMASSGTYGQPDDVVADIDRELQAAAVKAREVLDRKGGE
jgi:hypothetical protein